MKPKPSAEIGEASGATDDWMRGDVCMRFAYTFELPGFGEDFWPNEKYIWPTVRQVRNSINVMLRYIKGLASRDKGLAKKKWCDMSGNGKHTSTNTMTTKTSTTTTTGCFDEYQNCADWARQLNIEQGKQQGFCQNQ